LPAVRYHWVLLGLSLYSYYAQELLVCWLFFMVLTSLVLVILEGILVWCAGKFVIRWVSTAARVILTVVLGSTELRVKRAPRLAIAVEAI
jgi:hypothetical protein